MESYNRKIHAFNRVLDRTLLRPIALSYRSLTPAPINQGITHFFQNLADVNSAINNLFQFKLSRFGSDLARVATNSTVGVLGFFDVASNIGLPSYKEDFGQTFGYWGAEESPYLVLPVLGPSTLRDTVGLAGDLLADPFFSLEKNRIYWGFIALRAVDARADLLTASDLMESAALDPYGFLRDSYLQQRRHQIYDGNPPPDAYEEDIWAEESELGSESP